MFPNKRDQLMKGHMDSSGRVINSHELRQQKKEWRKADIIKNYSCKKAPYENGRLLAPDGKLLSYTDVQKGKWYISKGLATLVSEEPYTVKLNFEPSGRSMEGEEAWVDDQYYATDRENKCVVCGGKENFSRFHIVPTLYRTHFPDALKSHRSHDVLLLCFECHNKASRHQDVIKNELERKYDSPLH
jgi:hypothetical protein